MNEFLFQIQHSEHPLDRDADDGTWMDDDDLADISLGVYKNKIGRSNNYFLPLRPGTNDAAVELDMHTFTKITEGGNHGDQGFATPLWH
jgi:hypothetical protein